MNLFKKIINLGTGDETSVYERSRIILLNSISAIGLSFFLAYAIINLLNDKIFLGIFELGFVFLIGLPTLWLSKQKKHFLARNLISVSTLAIFLLISWVTVNGQRLTGAENIILIYPILIHFLHDKNRLFWGTIGLSIALGSKVQQCRLQGTELNGDHLMTIINQAAFFIVIYWLVGTFRNSVEHLTEEKTTLSEEKSISERAIELLRSMINVLPIYIGLIDKDGRYLLVSEQYSQTFQLPVAEIEGMRMSELLSEKYAERHIQHFEKSLLGKTIEYNEKSINEDGSKSHYVGSYTPIFNDEGEVIYSSVHGINISDLKNAEATLEASNRTKEILFSIIAHDLRGPFVEFQSLVGVSESLPAEETIQYFKKLGPKFDHLLFTLDNLLIWSRGQMDGFHVKPETFHLEDEAKQCITLLEDRFSKKNISLLTEFKHEKEIVCDKNHLRLALRNVLSNAVKFSPDAGEVSVSSEQLDGFVKINIQDNGNGMDQSTLDQLIKGEVVKPKVGTHKEQGSGLGLSLCKGLFEKNSCEMTIQSELGKGTTVSILIPLAKS